MKLGWYTAGTFYFRIKVKIIRSNYGGSRPVFILTFMKPVQFLYILYRVGPPEAIHFQLKPKIFIISFYPPRHVWAGPRSGDPAALFSSCRVRNLSGVFFAKNASFIYTVSVLAEIVVAT